MSPAKRPRRRSEPREVGPIIGSVLEDLGLEAAAHVFRIGEEWAASVGPEVARHARPMGMRAGVLEVQVDTSVWCQQLQLRRVEILRSLRLRLGEEEAPADLRFRVGYTSDS